MDLISRPELRLTVDSKEHRDLAVCCREHGYVKLAEYHEARAKETAGKKK